MGGLLVPSPPSTRGVGRCQGADGPRSTSLCSAELLYRAAHTSVRPDDTTHTHTDQGDHGARNMDCVSVIPYQADILYVNALSELTQRCDLICVPWFDSYSLHVEGFTAY